MGYGLRWSRPLQTRRWLERARRNVGDDFELDAANLNQVPRLECQCLAWQDALAVDEGATGTVEIADDRPLGERSNWACRPAIRRGLLPS